MNHSYFGELNLIDFDYAEVIWEKEFTLSNFNNPIRVTLWLWDNSSDWVTTEILDKCVNLIQRIEELHKIAKPYIINELETDSYFIDEHLEYVSYGANIPALKELIENNQVLPQTVYDLLNLQYVNIWLGKNDPERYFKAHISLYYQINPNESDQIIEVNFDLNGDFDYVAYVS
ncbi:MAG: DUF2004 domain-containing protein [Moraxella sp.]|uniref:DUF2004 domain-containing protein n=1 Tax=Moraxella sp. TaxID=479 RepID=UPI0026DA7E1A|nr:DUF2004 domain-containing protein [Moraxella sp.]MDO4449761.1 DUF2004 domain-containing protein [Moraxella sp.]